MSLVKALKAQKYKGVFTKRAMTSGDIKCRVSVKADSKKEYFLDVKFSDYTIVDDADDLMVKGCFTSSFGDAENSNRKVAFCWQHDTKDPIGTIVKWWEDEKGAYVTVKLSDFDAVPSAKRAWSQVNDGSINQASFGYNYDWDAVKYIRPEIVDGKTVKEGYFSVGNVFLHEVSLVTMGCNKNTEVLDARDAEKSLLKSFFEKDNVLNALMSLEDTEVKEFLKEQGVFIPEKTEVKKGLFSR